MLPTIALDSQHAKDIFPQDCVPKPGPELAKAIRDGEDAGLGVWTVPTGGGDYLVAPRLDAVPVIRHGHPTLVSPGVVSFERCFAERVAAGDGECSFDGELLAQLEGRPDCVSPLVRHALSASSPHEAVIVGERALAESSPALRRLAAAVLRDLCALPNEIVAEELGHTGDGADRQARRDVGAGRELWRHVPGSWPWWVLSDKWQCNWRHDSSVVTAWGAWTVPRVAEKRPTVGQETANRWPEPSRIACKPRTQWGMS